MEAPVSGDSSTVEKEQERGGKPNPVSIEFSETPNFSSQSPNYTIQRHCRNSRLWTMLFCFSFFHPKS